MNPNFCEIDIIWAMVDKNCFVTKPIKFVVRYFVQMHLNLLTHNPITRLQIDRYCKVSVHNIKSKVIPNLVAYIE